jgi:2-pyrone-4,6-dicarboxylate lactonase
VTGSANGTNNQVTLDALARMAGKFKGLALLHPSIADRELLRLKEGGITGFRVKGNGKGGLSFDNTKNISARVSEFGWHVESWRSQWRKSSLLCRSCARSQCRTSSTM